MKQLSLPGGFMLFLAIMFLAWQSRGWAEDWDPENIHNIQAVDGCAATAGVKGADPDPDRVKLSSALLSRIVPLYYPVSNANQNNQLGSGLTNPYLITEPADGVVMEQTLKFLKVYCQLAGDHVGGSPYLHINFSNNKRINDLLKTQKGLKMQFKLKDSAWYDIDDNSVGPLKMTDLVYTTYYNVRLEIPTTDYKRVNFTALPGAVGNAFVLSLRLVVVGAVKGSKEDSETGIPLDDLFYITPVEADSGAQKVTIQSTGNLKFAVARCKPTVQVPDQVDFGTLTAYKLNQGGAFYRNFRVTVSKDNTCTGGFPESDSYAVPNIKVMFTPATTYGTETAELLDELGSTFPGLSFSIVRADNDRALYFGDFYSLDAVLSESFISGPANNISRDFRIKIQKDPTKGDDVGTGEFHANVTVQISFN